MLYYILSLYLIIGSESLSVMHSGDNINIAGIWDFIRDSQHKILR